MATSPISQPSFRRSVTLPTRFQSSPREAQLDNAASGPTAETLFVYPVAKIVSFAAFTAGPSSSPRAQKQDTPGTLPWSKPTERVAAAGPIRLYRVQGSVSFLNSGELLLSLLPRSQCWCVDGKSKFAMKIQMYIYRIELPYDTSEDRAAVEEFEKVLDTILQYEKTPCPFKRHFYVELPEETALPRVRRSPGLHKKAKRWLFNDGWIPEGVDPAAFRQTPPTTRYNGRSASNEGIKSVPSAPSPGSRARMLAPEGGPLPQARLSLPALEPYRSVTSPPSVSLNNKGTLKPTTKHPGREEPDVLDEDLTTNGVVDYKTLEDQTPRKLCTNERNVQPPTLQLQLVLAPIAASDDGDEPLPPANPKKAEYSDIIHPPPDKAAGFPPLAPEQRSQPTIHPITPPDSAQATDSSAEADTPPQTVTTGPDSHRQERPSTPSPPVEQQSTSHEAPPAPILGVDADPATPPQTPITADWTSVSPPTTPPSVNVKSKSQRARQTPQASHQLIDTRRSTSRSFTTALVSTTYALLMAPPSNLVAVMMQIAARIANGALGANVAGAYRYRPGQGQAAGWVPGGWEDSSSEGSPGKRDSEDGWAGNDNDFEDDEEDDYGVPLGCDTPARSRRKAWGSAAAAATGRRLSDDEWGGSAEANKPRQDRAATSDVD